MGSYALGGSDIEDVKARMYDDLKIVFFDANIILDMIDSVSIPRQFRKCEKTCL